MISDRLIKNLYNPEPGQDEFNCYSIYDKILLGTHVETIDVLSINTYLSGTNVSISRLFFIQSGYCISLKKIILASL